MAESLISRRGGTSGEYEVYTDCFRHESGTGKPPYCTKTLDFLKHDYIVHFVSKNNSSSTMYYDTYVIKNGAVTEEHHYHAVEGAIYTPVIDVVNGKLTAETIYSGVGLYTYLSLVIAM